MGLSTAGEAAGGLGLAKNTHIHLKSAKSTPLKTQMGY